MSWDVYSPDGWIRAWRSSGRRRFDFCPDCWASLDIREPKYDSEEL